MDEPDGGYAPESPDLPALPMDLPPPNFEPYLGPQTSYQMPAYQIPQEQFQHHSSGELQYPPSISSPTYDQFGNFITTVTPPDATQADVDLQLLQHHNANVDQGTVPDSHTLPHPSTRRSRPLKPQQAAPESGPRPAFLDIEIRTKFPVARIKRIMQADEDIGKVAQVTPVAVSRALELFMISLSTAAADEARATNSKRITAVHLKRIVERDQQLDFLWELTRKVQDAPAAGQEKSEEVGADSEGKKKRGVGSKRRRKNSDEF